MRKRISLHKQQIIIGHAMQLRGRNKRGRGLGIFLKKEASQKFHSIQSLVY